MKWRRKFLSGKLRHDVIVFVLLASLPALAQGEGDIAALTMPQAMEYAVAKNPSIRAAVKEAQAARARPPQSATPPDPEFMVQFTQVPFDTNDTDAGMVEYMVEQEIPFPVKSYYGYKAKKSEAESLLHRQSLAEQEIIRQVRFAYLDAWRLQEEERINRQTVSVYEQNKASSETAYAALKSPVSDPVRAAVELGEIEAQLGIIEQERTDALARLSSLIAMTIDASTKLSEPSAPPSAASLDELIKRSKVQKPELLAAERAADSFEAQLSLAKAQYGPDLKFRWGYIDMPYNMQNAWTGRVTFSLPLWSLSKQRLGVRESKAMLASAKALKEEAELTAVKDIKSAYARLTTSRKVVDIYSGKVLPRARVLLSSSQEAYKAGRGDFLNIVDSIRSLNNAELMLVRAKADESKAYADLERAVGGDIGRSDL